MRLLTPVLAIAALSVAGCGRPAENLSNQAQPTSGGLEVRGQWVRESSAAVPVSAAYGRIRNSGSGAVRLIGGDTPLAGRVEIHTVVTENGVTRMRPLPDGLAIPAGGEVELRPGGDHIMLMDLKRPIRNGEQVPLTLRFDRAPALTIQLDARSATQSAHGGQHE